MRHSELWALRNVIETGEVYSFAPSSPGFTDLALVNPADMEQLISGFSGVLMSRSWVPPRVHSITDEPQVGTVLGDYAMLSRVPVFNQRCIDVIGEELLLAKGELLPLKITPIRFAYNVTCLLDALDEERSSVTRYSSGRIISINKFEFRPEVLVDATVFKLPQLSRGKTFMTGTFARLLQSAGLTGFDPEFHWSERG